MRIEKGVRFRKWSDDTDEATLLDEIEIFDNAVTPIERMNEYPDLVDALRDEHGIPDFDRARSIARAASHDRRADQTDLFPHIYLKRMRAVFASLKEALSRDLTIDYSPTAKHLVDVLLETRVRQIAAIVPALALLDTAIAATEGIDSRIVTMEHT